MIRARHIPPWLPTLALVGVVALSGIAGCGFKTDPRPAEHTSPVVPGVPTAEVVDGAVVVTWKRAVESADGRKLTDLEAFRVERLEGDGTWRIVAEVSVTDAERVRRQPKFSATDTEPGAGTRSYRVRARNADGQLGTPTVPVAIDVP